MTDHEGRKALNEIMARVDGVTPGDWDVDWIRSDNVHSYGVLTDQGFICDTLNADSKVVEIFRDYDGEGDFDDIDIQGMRNMQHFARCSPETFRAIAALVEELEEKLKDVGVECALRGVRLESKDAEIEKQRSDASYWCTANNSSENIIKAKDAEIERLREALLTIKDMSPQQLEDFEHRLVAERVLKETQS